MIAINSPFGFVDKIYQENVLGPLLTDAYHFTTPAAYFNEGRALNESIFYMFGRSEAFGGGYTVASGVRTFLDVYEHWRANGVPESTLDFLKNEKTPSGQRKFTDEYIDFLRNMKWQVQIDMAPEGSVILPQEPVLRLKGPQCQVKVLESIALAIMNGHSAYTTRAARCVEAAEYDFGNGSPKGIISSQGLRRGPGIGAAIESIDPITTGGAVSTSTGVSAEMMGVPFAGTMDHQWIMSHKNELNKDKGAPTMADLFDIERLRDKAKAENKTRLYKKYDLQLKRALSLDAFRSYAFTHREAGIFLLDTRDPIIGLDNAITVIKEMHALGLGKNYGVRFDSGDLVAYSKKALRRFAEEGLVEGVTREMADSMDDAALLYRSANAKAFCAVADGLDEFSIYNMRKAGCFYKSFGVGTALSHPDPLGMVYKMSSLDMEVRMNNIHICPDDELSPTMKIASNSPAKSSNPGMLNSLRRYDNYGILQSAVLFDEITGLDANGEVVNLRNFNERGKFAGEAATTKPLLVPVYSRGGERIYQGPPMKPLYNGAQVPDLAAINQVVRSSIASLPEETRRIAKPRSELLRNWLFERYLTNPHDAPTLDLSGIATNLPPEVIHVPVFIDANLLQTRQKVELEYLGKVLSGVSEYTERFNKVARPDPHISGDLLAKGNKEMNRLVAPWSI